MKNSEYIEYVAFYLKERTEQDINRFISHLVDSEKEALMKVKFKFFNELDKLVGDIK